MKLALVPRPTEFYDLFSRAGQNALEAARQGRDAIPRVSEHRRDPGARKGDRDRGRSDHAGSDPASEHPVRNPVRPGGHLQLARAIDDVVDYIEEATDLLELYRIEQPAKQAIEQCRILVGAVECLARALDGLKGRRGVQDALVELKSLEDEGDRVVRDAIAALFQDARIDPLIVIRWKDIYEALETALDACRVRGECASGTSS